MTTPPILRATHVPRDVETTFDVFADRIGAWWPLTTHSVYGAASAGVAFEDGRLVERCVDGRSCVWAEVLDWDRPKRLRLTWHPGADGGPAAEVEVTFLADDEGTRVELAHRGWQAYGDAAVVRRASYVGPDAWGAVLDHFADTAEPRTPATQDADLLAALEGAYGRFWSTADKGGFAAPADGGWDAAHVMAHMVGNDGELAAVTRAVLTGGEPRMDNAAATSMALEALLTEAGGDPGRLVAAGRRSAADLLLLLARLDEDQRGRPVPTHLVDAGHVVLDETVPWWRLMTLQARRHLPSHTAQLEALRP